MAHSTTTDRAADVSQSQSKPTDTSVIDRKPQESKILHHGAFSTVFGDTDVSIEKYFDMLDAVNSSDQLLAAEDIFKAVTTPVVDDFTTDALSRTSEQIKNEHIKEIFQKLLPGHSDPFNTEKTTTPVTEVVYETYGELFEDSNSSKTAKEDAVPQIDPEMYDYEAHSKEVEAYTKRLTTDENLALAKTNDVSAFATSFATSTPSTFDEELEKTTQISTDTESDRLLKKTVTELKNELKTKEDPNSDNEASENVAFSYEPTTTPTDHLLTIVTGIYKVHRKEEQRDLESTSEPGTTSLKFSAGNTEDVKGFTDITTIDNYFSSTETNDASEFTTFFATSEKPLSSLRNSKIDIYKNENVQEVTSKSAVTSNVLFSNDKQNNRTKDILTETGRFFEAKEELQASENAKLDFTSTKSSIDQLLATIVTEAYNTHEKNEELQLKTTSQPGITPLKLLTSNNIEEVKVFINKTINDNHSARSEDFVDIRRENEVDDPNSTSFIDVNGHKKQNASQVILKEILTGTERLLNTKEDVEASTNEIYSSTLSSIIEITTTAGIVKKDSQINLNEADATLTNESSTPGVLQQTNFYTKNPIVSIDTVADNQETSTESDKYNGNGDGLSITEVSVPEKTNRHVMKLSKSRNTKTIKLSTKTNLLNVENNTPVKDLPHQSFSHVLNKETVNTTAGHNINAISIQELVNPHYACLNISFIAAVYKAVSK